MKKLIILLTIILSIAVFAAFSHEGQTEKCLTHIIEPCIESSIYNDILLEDDSIIVVLDKESSLNTSRFNTNTLSSQLDVLHIEDLTYSTSNLVQKQLLAEQTGDWSALQPWIDNNMLVDTTNFRRILSITLRNSSPRNMQHAMSVLENTAGIDSANKEFAFKTTSPSISTEEILDTNNTQSTNTAPLSSANLIWNLGINTFGGIAAQAAWNTTRGNRSVLVGVLDTGVDRFNRYLSASLNTNLHRDFTRVNWRNAVQPADPSGHGTQVAGIIAGSSRVVNVNGSDREFSGVAPNATVVSLQVATQTTVTGQVGDAITVRRLVRALDFATESNIPILNMSFGIEQDRGDNYFNNTEISQAMANFPGLMVISAGNTNRNNNFSSVYPANFIRDQRFSDRLIVVGAANSERGRAVYTNWGSNYGTSTVCIFAPGINIVTTNNAGRPFETNAHGTSFAAAHVSGVAALIRSMRPNLSAAAVKRLILDNSDSSPAPISTPSGGAQNTRVRHLNAASVVARFDTQYIYTPAQLNDIRDNPHGRFVITYTIRLEGNWNPIPRFYGILEAANLRTISSLNINSTGTALNDNLYLGLIGRLYGTVKNLSIGSGTINVGTHHGGNGWIRAGLVAGYVAQTGTIRNVHVLINSSVSVHRYRSSIGLIAGYSRGTVVTNRINATNLRVVGSGNMGVIVGEAVGGTIAGNNVLDARGSVRLVHYRVGANRGVGGIVGSFFGPIGVSQNNVSGILIERQDNNGTPMLGGIIGNLRSPTNQNTGNTLANSHVILSNGQQVILHAIGRQT